MNINVVLDYKDAGKFYHSWANDEENINFEEDAFSAKRCTLSYAAMELCCYLNKLGHNADVSQVRKDGINIFISAGDSLGEEFDITTDRSDIFLRGESRKGALYAVYELLELQGIRWYSPQNEYVPKKSDFIFPESRHYKYDLPQGRGFHFEQISKESRKLAIWMARNRLNIHACYANIKKLQQKLCFTFMTGGHIFKELLAPNRIDENGERYFDSHRDWYGKRDYEITMETAQSVQFCVSNEELLEELARIIIERLNNEWRDADICELAGFDAWGGACNCEKCIKLGNGSDHILHFISHIRDCINKAYENGIIKKQVKLVYDIYEGTKSLQPPVNPIPQNILDAGDIAMFCPISRCYAHDFSDETCPMNTRYNEAFDTWVKMGANVLMNEYYNVSVFEDLPVMFTNSMKNDIKYYIENGVNSIVYMHVPVLELGPRVLTQYLYANLSRNKLCNSQNLIDKYFEDVYSGYSEFAKKAYELLEKGTSTCASWRAAGTKSVSTILRRWNLDVPNSPLYEKPCEPVCKNPAELYATNPQEVVNIHMHAHFKGNLADECHKYLDNLNDSYITFKKIKHGILSEISECSDKLFVLNKVNEDIRSLKYCRDFFELLSLFIDYYYAMYEGKTDTSAITDRILELGEEMSEYTFGVRYENYTPDMEALDVLTRSKLDIMYYKLVGKLNKNQ